MALTMTKEEREAFLADIHVAVMSVAEDGHGPLVVPIWYSYEPGGEVRIITGRASRKGKLLERAGRFSLCVQTEALPYKYVSVEGPIVAVEAADPERDRRPLARRYLGTELGDRYIENTRDVVGGVLVRMRPERWLTVDYAKHPNHDESLLTCGSRHRVTQRPSMQPHNDIVERSGSEQPAAHHARYAEVRSPRPENTFGYSTRFGTRPLKTHQLGREAGEALRLALAAARFSHEMLSMHVAQLGQAARDRRSTAVSPDVGYS